MSGCEFPNRKIFIRSPAKFAIYNDFTLKYLRTNMTKVTVCCKDENCLWCIHVFIVELSPQFKGLTYSVKHYY